MNKVLVLGASGLLGRALVKHLVFEGYEVGALSRSCMNNNNNAFILYRRLSRLSRSPYKHIKNKITQYITPA